MKIKDLASTQRRSSSGEKDFSTHLHFFQVVTFSVTQARERIKISIKTKRKILKFKSHANIFSMWLMVFVIQRLQAIGSVCLFHFSYSWYLINQKDVLVFPHSCARSSEQILRVHVRCFWGNLSHYSSDTLESRKSNRKLRKKNRNVKCDEIYNMRRNSVIILIQRWRGAKTANVRKRAITQ